MDKNIEELEKDPNWLEDTRVMIGMTKAFRYELKKRATIRNISMKDYVQAACIEAMKLEDSYNQ